MNFFLDLVDIAHELGEDSPRLRFIDSADAPKSCTFGSIGRIKFFDLKLG